MSRRCALSAVFALSSALAPHTLRAQGAGTVVNGRVVVQVFVTLQDDNTPYHPVAGLPLGFMKSPRDTTIAITDRSGSVVVLLAPGRYRVISLAPTQWKGMRYLWNSPVAVAEDMGQVNLRRADAMVSRIGAKTVTTVSDGETVVTIEKPAPRPAPAVAPAPAPAPVMAPAPAVVAAPPVAERVERVEHVEHVEAPAVMPRPRVNAGRSRSDGFFVGLGVEGNGLQTTAAGSTMESGGGAGMVFGYGFTRRWSLYMNLSGAQMNATGGGTYSLAHADLGIRMHFRSGHTIVPFLQFGATGRAVQTNLGGTTVTGSGGGGTLGGGFNAYFTRSVALSTDASWSTGTFNNFQVDNLVVNNVAVNAMTARVHLGLVWFP